MTRPYRHRPVYPRPLAAGDTVTLDGADAAVLNALHRLRDGGRHRVEIYLTGPGRVAVDLVRVEGRDTAPLANKE